MKRQKLFAIVGNPVLHSKSPLLFRAAYPGREELIYLRMAAGSVEEALRLLRELGIGGINITAPFKPFSLWQGNRISKVVEVLGMTNTAIFEEDELVLLNTDVDGVSGALAAEGVEVAGKRCVVLGAGGAGAAVAYALQREGGIVTVINRTDTKAEELARKVGCQWAEFRQLEEYVRSGEIIAYTLLPGVDVVEEGWLQLGQVVLDALYHGSRIREKALAAGCCYIGGEGWLIWQGVSAYRAFTGIEPDLLAMQKELPDLLFPRHVVLTGLMGVGKSTTGVLLAEMMGRPFWDTDQLVELAAGMSVPEMIRRQGVDTFRRVEKQVMAKLLDEETPVVIACGGGSLLDPEINRRVGRESLGVWLHASPEICLQRIEPGSRPLLDHDPEPLNRLRELLDERKFSYAAAAQLLLATDNRDPQAVAQRIYGEINQAWSD